MFRNYALLLGLLISGCSLLPSQETMPPSLPAATGSGADDLLAYRAHWCQQSEKDRDDYLAQPFIPGSEPLAQARFRFWLGQALAASCDPGRYEQRLMQAMLQIDKQTTEQMPGAEANRLISLLQGFSQRQRELSRANSNLRQKLATTIKAISDIEQQLNERSEQETSQ